MALDGIKVNHEGLLTAADQLKQTMDKIDERLNQLERELENLQSDWAGDQRTAYYEAKAKWDKAIMEMNQLLGETSNAVRTSQGDYAAADANGAKRFMV